MTSHPQGDKAGRGKNENANLGLLAFGNNSVTGKPVLIGQKKKGDVAIDAGGLSVEVSVLS